MAKCINCGDPPKVCLLCGSCWRMAVVAPAIVEAIHRLAVFLFS